jgi:hypothetical protein
MNKTAAFEAGLADAMEKAAMAAGVLKRIKDAPGRVRQGAEMAWGIAKNPKGVRDTAKAMKDMPGGEQVLSKAKGDLAHAAGAAGAVGATGVGLGYAATRKRKK